VTTLSFMTVPSIMNRQAWWRVVASLLCGAISFAAVKPFTRTDVALLVLWLGTALPFIGVTWWQLHRLDAEATRHHALREDPSRALADIVLTFASIVSLGSVGFVVAGATHHGTLAANARLLLAVVSVVVSWMLVHTVFTLRYARMYYGDVPGGIDFHSDAEPQYSDFAYVAFTVGMSYAASDTDITDCSIRRAILRQALLSYFFGAVIIAATINLVAGLAA